MYLCTALQVRQADIPLHGIIGNGIGTSYIFGTDRLYSSTYSRHYMSGYRYNVRVNVPGTYLHCLKFNFPINSHVCQLVGWLDGWSAWNLYFLLERFLVQARPQHGTA